MGLWGQTFSAQILRLSIARWAIPMLTAAIQIWPISGRKTMNSNTVWMSVWSSKYSTFSPRFVTRLLVCRTKSPTIWANSNFKNKISIFFAVLVYRIRLLFLSRYSVLLSIRSSLGLDDFGLIFSYFPVDYNEDGHWLWRHLRPYSLSIDWRAPLPTPT